MPSQHAADSMLKSVHFKIDALKKYSSARQLSHGQQSSEDTREKRSLAISCPIDLDEVANDARSRGAKRADPKLSIRKRVLGCCSRCRWAVSSSYLVRRINEVFGFNSLEFLGVDRSTLEHVGKSLNPWTLKYKSHEINAEYNEWIIQRVRGLCFVAGIYYLVYCLLGLVYCGTTFKFYSSTELSAAVWGWHWSQALRVISNLLFMFLGLIPLSTRSTLRTAVTLLFLLFISDCVSVWCLLFAERSSASGLFWAEFYTLLSCISASTVGGFVLPVSFPVAACLNFTATLCCCLLTLIDVHHYQEYYPLREYLSVILMFMALSTYAKYRAEKPSRKIFMVWRHTKGECEVLRKKIKKEGHQDNTGVEKLFNELIESSRILKNGIDKSTDNKNGSKTSKEHMESAYAIIKDCITVITGNTNLYAQSINEHKQPLEDHLYGFNPQLYERSKSSCHSVGSRVVSAMTSSSFFKSAWSEDEEIDFRSSSAGLSGSSVGGGSMEFRPFPSNNFRRFSSETTDQHVVSALTRVQSDPNICSDLFSATPSSRLTPGGFRTAPSTPRDSSPTAPTPPSSHRWDISKMLPFSPTKPKKPRSRGGHSPRKGLVDSTPVRHKKVKSSASDKKYTFASFSFIEDNQTPYYTFDSITSRDGITTTTDAADSTSQASDCALPQPCLLDVSFPALSQASPYTKPRKLCDDFSEKIGTHWYLDITKLASPLLTVGYYLLRPLRCHDGLRCSESTLIRFISVIQSLYNEANPYHSAAHGATVAHSVMCLVGILFGDNTISIMDTLTVIIAGLVHDVGHPGRSNAFLINSFNAVAMMYNDKSVLENYHTALTFTVLSCTGLDILSGLAERDFRIFRQTLIDLVLATDMASNAESISQYKLRRKSPEFDPEMNPEDKRMLTKLIIKAGDLSHACLLWQQHQSWSWRCNEEFWLQGDEEALMKVPISPLCDRSKASDLAKNQLTFLAFAVEPLYNEISQTDTTGQISEVVITCLQDNVEHWKRLDEAQLTAEQLDRACRRNQMPKFVPTSMTPATLPTSCLEPKRNPAFARALLESACTTLSITNSPRETIDTPCLSRSPPPRPSEDRISVDCDDSTEEGDDTDELTKLPHTSPTPFRFSVSLRH